MGATHLQALRRIPEASVAAVVSRDPEKLRRGPAQQGNLGAAEPIDLTGLRICEDLQEVLGDGSVDAVDICLPTDLHADAAIASLETRSASCFARAIASKRLAPASDSISA